MTFLLLKSAYFMSKQNQTDQVKNIIWQCKPFKKLTLDELYDALKLRIDVFVVEQTCYYPDLDDLDRHPETVHLFCYQNNIMTAYARLLPKGLTYQENPSIGRVIVKASARGTGLSHLLMKQALTISEQIFPEQIVKISAQAHLEQLYNQHGFVKCSDVYLEDGIPHIAMLQQPTN